MRKNIKKVVQIVRTYWEFYLTGLVSFMTVIVAASLFNALPALSGAGWIVNLLFTLVFFGASIAADVFYFKLDPIDYLLPRRLYREKDRNWSYAGILLLSGMLIATIMVLLSDSPAWAVLLLVLLIAFLFYRWTSTGGKVVRDTTKDFKDKDERNKKEYIEAVKLLRSFAFVISVGVGILAFIHGRGWFTWLIIIAWISYIVWRSVARDLYQPDVKDRKDYDPGQRTRGLRNGLFGLCIVIALLIFLVFLPLAQDLSASVHGTPAPVVVNYSGQPASTTTSTGDDGVSTPIPDLPTPTPSPVVTPSALPAWTGAGSFAQTVDTAMTALSKKFPNIELQPATTIVLSNDTLDCEAVTDELNHSSIQVIDGSNSDPSTGIAWCPAKNEFAASTASLSNVNTVKVQAYIMIAIGRWWILRQKYQVRPGFTASMAGAILQVMGESLAWMNTLAATLPTVNYQNTFMPNGYAQGAARLQRSQV